MLFGRTGCGKSTLAKVLLQAWKADHPTGTLVIFDSKPRWGASWLVTGFSAKRVYRNRRAVDWFPSSYLVRDVDEWKAAWALRHRPGVAIVVQAEDNPDFHAAIATYVYREMGRDKGRTLVYVDEFLDHFGPGGHPLSRYGGIWARWFRNGRELGGDIMTAAQRTKTIPIAAMENASHLVAFELDFEQDQLRYREMGARNLPNPRGHEFYLFRRSDRRWRGPFVLSLGS